MNMLKVVGFIEHTSLLHQVSLPFSLLLLQKPLTILWLVAAAAALILVLAAAADFSVLVQDLP
jgi:hypothetical protein